MGTLGAGDLLQDRSYRGPVKNREPAMAGEAIEQLMWGPVSTAQSRRI